MNTIDMIDEVVNTDKEVIDLLNDALFERVDSVAADRFKRGFANALNEKFGVSDFVVEYVTTSSVKLSSKEASVNQTMHFRNTFVIDFE